MLRTAATLLTGLVFVLAGWVLAAPASACSCTGGTTAEFFARADAVFTGSLGSRSVDRPPGPIGSSTDPALHVFAVDTVFKGTASERQGVVSPESGASCGLELTGDGQFAVFATRDATLGETPFTPLAEGQYAAFLCGGTTELTPALEAELRALAAPGRLPGRRHPARRLPDPARPAPSSRTADRARSSCSSPGSRWAGSRCCSAAGGGTGPATAGRRAADPRMTILRRAPRHR
ncbi:hypothetical protein [Blastococcus saxobsidens]|uniref:Tissue inhibitor of metalloproteinase n=1 Tax=Blastococcus saxobsidens (strain DD2) TaxID=1146883 RepID=H6RSC3_BLASD|nr:hypothetical protein [Blastococcus saxobsidens]CCG05515.1 conserved protein of unknown function [Blastococcus saxobsidens DD2]